MIAEAGGLSFAESLHRDCIPSGLMGGPPNDPHRLQRSVLRVCEYVQ